MVFWIGFILFIAFCVGYEAWAVAHKYRTGEDQTITNLVRTVTRAYPFNSVLVSLVVGGLLVHFFWFPC